MCRHLHLDLRKIYREIDSIFGIQMVLKMVCYFGWMIIDLREILYAVLIKNYVKSTITCVTLRFIWFSHNVFKFLLINHICETVTIKVFILRLTLKNINLNLLTNKLIKNY